MWINTVSNHDDLVNVRICAPTGLYFDNLLRMRPNHALFPNIQSNCTRHILRWFLQIWWYGHQN